MQVQRVHDNNSYNTHFSAQLAPETISLMRSAMHEVSRERFNCRLNYMPSWGQEDSVVRYCIEGINKDRFVLTNPRLGEGEIPITGTTKNKGLVATFFDEVYEKRITRAEEFLTVLGNPVQAIRNSAEVLRKAGFETTAEQINKILNDMTCK